MIRNEHWCYIETAPLDTFEPKWIRVGIKKDPYRQNNEPACWNKIAHVLEQHYGHLCWKHTGCMCKQYSGHVLEQNWILCWNNSGHVLEQHSTRVQTKMDMWWNKTGSFVGTTLDTCLSKTDMCWNKTGSFVGATVATRSNKNEHVLEQHSTRVQKNGHVLEQQINTCSNKSGHVLRNTIRHWWNNTVSVFCSYAPCVSLVFQGQSEGADSLNLLLQVFAWEDCGMNGLATASLLEIPAETWRVTRDGDMSLKRYYRVFARLLWPSWKSRRVDL